MRRMMFLMVVFSLFYGMAKGSKYKSKVPIRWSKEDCIRFARKTLQGMVRYKPFLEGAQLTEPIPYKNAYEETVAYCFDVVKDGRYMAVIEVDRFRDSIWADFDMGVICYPRDTFPLVPFSVHGPEYMGRCYEVLKGLGYDSSEVRFRGYYYFPCAWIEGIERASAALVRFDVEGGKVILIDPVTRAVIPDSIGLMGLQRLFEKNFPEVQRRAREKQKEYEEWLKKQKELEGGWEIEGVDSIDFSGEVTPLIYHDIKTLCCAGACVTVLEYWMRHKFLDWVNPEYLADEFESEWGNGGESPSNMPGDIIKAFNKITKEHENGWDFEAIGFSDFYSYRAQMYLRHPVDLNFLEGNSEDYCNNHACTGVGLIDVGTNQPKMVVYTGWYLDPEKPYYYQNCNFIAVSTWPDRAPPHVVYTYPHGGQEDVRIDLSSITIVFSKSMDTQSTQRAISIIGADGNGVEINSFAW